MADLGPMTPDLGVYARDVQQSIAVNIRNYMKPDPNAMNVNPSNNPNINMNPNPPGMNMNGMPMGQNGAPAAGGGQNGNMPGAPGAGGQNGNMPGAPGGGQMPRPPEDPPIYVPPPRDAYRYTRPGVFLYSNFTTNFAIHYTTGKS